MQLARVGQCGDHHSCTFLPARSQLHSGAQRTNYARRRRTSRLTRAELDQETITAVLQQGVAYVAFVLGEGFYTRTQLKAGAKGRPSVPTLALNSAALIMALTLIAASGEGARPGLAAGVLASGVLFFVYLRRALDTEHNPREWPGPKAWPSTMLLVTFASVNVFGQALLKAIQV